MKSIYPLCHTVFSLLLKRAIAFFILVFFTVTLEAQTPISGVVNTYHKVIDTVLAKACVRVDNTTGLAHGDMVLLVQMKGATISTNTNSTFGDISAMNEAGNYEVATICAVIDDSVFFFHNLINTYKPSGKVQLVKFAEYFSAEVVDTVKAASWDSTTGKGGVIAIRVDETLTLSAPIYGDSSGNRGGAFFLHSGNCPVGSLYAYDATNFGAGANGAYKGESVADVPQSLDGGKGAPANGGAGGNNHNNSGGGGANLVAGGAGGGNSSSGPFGCNTGNNWGRGGKALNSSGGTKIFLGGGGGAGHSNGGVFTQGGGNGGAIVFIWAPILIGGGQTISANGGGGGASLSDGAGGGGAGGTIIMNVGSYSGSLFIRAIGGNGGNSNDDLIGGRCFGGGGGGSGGVIYFTGGIPGAPVTITDTAGTGGTEINRSGTCGVVVPGATGTDGQTISSYSFTSSTDPAGYCLLLLPSQLMSFQAILVSKKVLLQWEILQPELANRFIIERKANNGQWIEINSQFPFNGQEQYSAMDAAPLTGTSFYRLKIIEQNGGIHYSETRFILFNPLHDAFTFYPNPAQKTITIIGDFSSPVVLRLLALSGRIILQKQLVTNRIELGLPDLPAGIYMIRIGQSVKKLIIR